MDIGAVKDDINGLVTCNQQSNTPVKGAPEGRDTERAVVGGDDDEAFNPNSRSGDIGRGDGRVGSAQVLPTDVVDKGCCGADGDTSTTQPQQQPPKNGTHDGKLSPILTLSSLGDDSQDQEDTHSEGSVAQNNPVGGGSIDEDSVVTKDTTTVSQTAAPTPSAGRAFSSASSSDPGTDTSDDAEEMAQDWSLEHNHTLRGEGRSAGATRQFEGGVSNNNDNNLPAQLLRLWGTTSPPDHAKGLAAMQEMFGSRQELDGILSRLASTKVRSVGEKLSSAWGSCSGSRMLCTSVFTTTTTVRDTT